MKPEPIKYTNLIGETVGCFFATMSPDGWCKTYYQPEMGRQLTPEERLEFIRLVTSFMRCLQDRDDLDNFSRKYGKVLTPGVLPQFGITFSDTLMDYSVSIMGCNVEFVPHRKENA